MEEAKNVIIISLAVNCYFTTVDYIGQGLPILLPNGARVIQQLSRFVEDEEERRGYLLTKTPYFAKVIFIKFPVTGTITVTVCLYWEKRKRVKMRLHCAQ